MIITYNYVPYLRHTCMTIFVLYDITTKGTIMSQPETLSISDMKTPNTMRK